MILFGKSFSHKFTFIVETSMTTVNVNMVAQPQGFSAIVLLLGLNQDTPRRWIWKKMR